MHYDGPPFIDRKDAGLILAEYLKTYKKNGAAVFAIPHGGVPVAVEVAKIFSCELDIIVPRKIPIPYNTEAGYGAVTEDGVIVLNEPMVRQLGLSEQDIKRHAQTVMEEISRRQQVFRKIISPLTVTGKPVIVIDDGLASGFTMAAAIKSLRRRGAKKVIAAAPVASESGWQVASREADEVACPVISSSYPFAVASFYSRWHDLDDKEVIQHLKEFKEYCGDDYDSRSKSMGKAGQQ
jgi:putative phosphoribosyl transferase